MKINEEDAYESRKGERMYELKQREDQCDEDVRCYMMPTDNT